MKEHESLDAADRRWLSLRMQSGKSLAREQSRALANEPRLQQVVTRARIVNSIRFVLSAKQVKRLRKEQLVSTVASRAQLTRRCSFHGWPMTPRPLVSRFAPSLPHLSIPAVHTLDPLV